MLVPAGYDMTDCFFTNAWPVLRRGNSAESGYHAMRDNGEFTRDCRAFFARTLKNLEPRIVVTLGIAPAWFVGPFAGVSWRPSQFNSSRDMRATDLDNEPVRAASGIIYVAGTHWSRISNSRYRGLTADDERRLLRRALQCSRSVPDTVMTLQATS
jgi:uracil-DNA glycosylase